MAFHQQDQATGSEERTALLGQGARGCSGSQSLHATDKTFQLNQRCLSGGPNSAAFSKQALLVPGGKGLDNGVVLAFEGVAAHVLNIFPEPQYRLNHLFKYSFWQRD